MSPLPAQFTDRWGSQRTGPSYEDAVCWHVLLGADPAVRSTMRGLQRQLARFGGFHATPERWLHMTVLLAGPATEITPGQRGKMLAAAGNIISGAGPVTMTLERVVYGSQGIALQASPATALGPLLDAARAATLEVTGQPGLGGDLVPHMTVGYSTGEQPAAPVIAALGKKVPPCEVTIDRLSLVVQNGAEDCWDWHVEGAVDLSGALR